MVYFNEPIEPEPECNCPICSRVKLDMRTVEYSMPIEAFWWIDYVTDFISVSDLAWHMDELIEQLWHDYDGEGFNN